MPRNYNERIEVAVELKIGAAVIQYGFRSGVKKATDRTVLGQVTLGELDDDIGLVIGCNSPKPGIATKKDTDDNGDPISGSIRSFYASDAVTGLKTAGWKLSTPKSSGSIDGVVFITINGIKYGWQPPDMPAGVVKPTIDFGAEAATANDIICFGCQFPKPPRMATELTGGKSFSTFVAPSKVDDLKAAGWRRSGAAKTQSLKTGVTP